MGKVSKRDLNQHTASVLRRVTAVDDIVVTEHGKPRWRITSYRDQDEPLSRMESAGHYAPPTKTPMPWPSRPGGPKYSDVELEELLDEMRGDH